jgi:hypothetical protein
MSNEQSVTLNLVDADWHPVTAELNIRRDTVEIRCRERLVAVQDRDRLAEWLARPDGLLTCDELSWLWSGWSISIHIRNLVPPFALTMPVIEDIRRHLAPGQS